MGAAPLLAGAEVPAEADDEVPDDPELAVEVARVELPPVTEALPEAEAPVLACVSEGRVTDVPALPEAAGAVVVPAGAVVATVLVTVGTEAAGVTWIWPSEYWDTGTRVEVAVLALVVMLAQGVVPT